MRIISSFYDYYDILQSYTDDLVYVRESSELPGCRDIRSYTHYHKHSLGIDFCVIGFCGKYYPAIHMLSRIIYNVEELNALLSHIPTQRRKLIPEDDIARLTTWITGEVVKIPIYGYTSRTKEQRDKAIAFMGTHFSYKCASIYLDEKVLVLNPNLSKLNFQKVFPPYEAFQELSMFIGNATHPERNIPHVDDKTLAEAKGFDKWSFRKEPRCKK